MKLLPLLTQWICLHHILPPDPHPSSSSRLQWWSRVCRRCCSLTVAVRMTLWSGRGVNTLMRCWLVAWPPKHRVPYAHSFSSHDCSTCVVVYTSLSNIWSMKKTALGRSNLVVIASDCSVRGPRSESHCGQLCLSRWQLWYAALGTGWLPLLQCLGSLSLASVWGR